MADNLKIDVVLADVGESGVALSNYVTKDVHTQDLSEKADLVGGKVKADQLPAFTDLNGVTAAFSGLETTLRSETDAALVEAKVYADGIVSNAMLTKADLVSGRVPADQATEFKDVPGAKGVIDGLKQSFQLSIQSLQNELRENYPRLENNKIARINIPNDILMYSEDLTQIRNEFQTEYVQFAADVNQTRNELQSGYEAFVVNSDERYAGKLVETEVDNIIKNGASLPYNPSIQYLEGSIVRKDGELKQLIDGEWVSSLVAASIKTKSSQTQQDINDRGGATWYAKSGGYGLNDRVVLENGDEVKSTEPNNINNPNVDMMGWVNPSKDQKDLNDKLTSINQLLVSPKWFGSPNNGTDDDAHGIRAAIAFIKLNGGGVIDLESKTEWVLKTKHSTDDCHFVIDFQNFAFSGGTQTSKLKSYISVETQVLLKNGIGFLAFLNTNWHGNYLANYNVKTEDNKFAPYLYTLNSTFFVTNIAAMRVNTYVSNFTLTRWGFSGDGLQINPNGDTATSLSFNSSYAQNCTGSGFKTIGSVIYSVFNACASDHCDISYDLNYCNVVVLNGCGSEQTRKPLKITNSASVIVNGICLLGCGSTDTLNPIDALIDVTDSRLILDGYRNLTMEGRTTYYTKEAKTQGWGFIDARRSQSLSRKNVSKGTHVDYESTIWCFDDETHADQTVTLAPNALAAWITDNLRGRTINHKITIQLTGGVESSGLDNKVLQYMKGYGSVIIQGDALNRSNVVILGAHTKLQSLDNTCNIIFKNLTILNSDSNDRSFHQLYARESKLIILDNVNISATGQIGAAVYAGGDTTVKFINNAEATQTLNGNYQATITVIAENGAEVIYEPRSTAPTTGYYGRSTFIPAKQNANDILGWYCDGSGLTVSGWKTSKVYTGI